MNIPKQGSSSQNSIQLKNTGDDTNLKHIYYLIGNFQNIFQQTGLNTANFARSRAMVWELWGLEAGKGSHKKTVLLLMAGPLRGGGG